MTIREIMEHRIALALKINPDYNPDRDFGLVGDCLETAVKLYFNKPDPWKISRQGAPDVYIHARHIEIKQGAGELGLSSDKKLLKGSGQVIYVPVVLLDYPLEMQDGYVMEKTDFLNALAEAGALRTKAGRNGGPEKITVQTFWNRKENKPHGRLFSRMQDAFESYEYEELVDYLANNR